MRVHIDDLAHFTPAMLAIFIDAGFMTTWPHEWTRRGARAIRRHSSDDDRSYSGIEVLREAERDVTISRVGTITGLTLL